jgi:hypothetical protein
VLLCKLIDAITNRILQECAEQDASLVIIFQRSLDPGDLPADWLNHVNANVTPVLKKEDTHIAENHGQKTILMSLASIIS